MSSRPPDLSPNQTGSVPAEHRPRRSGRARPLTFSQGASHRRLFSGRLAGLAWSERGALLLSIGLGLGIGAAYITQGVLVAVALSRVLAKDDPISIAWPLAAAVAFVLVRGAAIGWRDASSAAASVRIAASLRRRLYAQVLRLGPGWLSGRRTGELQTTMVDGVDRLDAYFRLFLAQGVVSLITAIAVTVLVLALDWVVGAVVALCLLVVVFGPSIGYRVLGHRLAFWETAYRPLAAEYVDNLQGMATLKALGASGRRGATLAASADAVRDAAIRLNNAQSVQYGIVTMASVAGSALTLGVGALRHADGALSTGSLLIILLLVRECFRPVRELQDALHLAMQGMAAGEHAFAVLDQAPAVIDGPRTATLASAGGSVRFEGVSFRYQPERALALDDFSLSAEEGQTVALVGRSGAGKTTAVSLLLRFFDPEQGRIGVGGSEVRSLSLRELRSRIALVSQDTYLFGGSVRDNLLMARGDASQAQLVDAARAADALGFIEQLPQGWETTIGERGLKLSGGERQRLAIARALLRDAPILVLDEATSSVDVASEAAIQRSLEMLMRDRTTLVIAHRLSTVRRADHVVVLDAGRVVEEGTPDRLVRADGVYRRLVDSQALVR